MDDIDTLKLHRFNHLARIRQAAIPYRDPLFQSTLSGDDLIPHRRIKQIRKQYNFLTVDEFSIKNHQGRGRG